MSPQNRYSRQMGLRFVGESGQARLQKARVGILGCGALGTVASDLLVRAGVGFVRVIDRDVVDLVNLQRQTLFTEQDAAQRLPKAVAAQSRLREVNSEVVVEPMVMDYGYDNALELINGLDVVVDATDNYLTRLTLNDACLELKVPWVYGGGLGTFGMSAVFLPEGPCFRCLMSELPEPGAGESCDLSGVLGSVTSIVGSIQAAEVIKLITAPSAVRKDIIEFDLLSGEFRTLPVINDPQCEACKKGKRDFLSPLFHQSASVVCGRDSVLLRQPYSGLHLVDVAERVASKGWGVKVNRFRLQVLHAELELIIFADGRALVNGTSDVPTAKGFYNEVIGI